MAKLSVPPSSAFGLRLVDSGSCDYCLRDGEVVYWELRRSPEARAKRTALCVECMLSACEALTGYGFVNQLHNWQRLSALHASTAPKPTTRKKS